MRRFILWGLFLFIIAALSACQTATPETATQQPVSPTPTILPTNTLVPPSPAPTITPAIATPTATPTVVIEPTAAPTLIPTITPAPTIPPSSRSLDLTLVAHTGGAATGLALADNGRLAYITVGPRLLLYDVADRRNPQLRWQSEPFAQPFVTLVKEGEYIFGRLPDRWVVWQISTTTPIMVWESQPEAAKTSGYFYVPLADKLYLRAGIESWLVFDSRSPQFPLATVTQAGNIQPVSGGLIIEQRTAEGYDLLFAEGQTLPANVVGRLSFTEPRHIVAIHESYLYLSATHWRAKDGLVISFSDLSKPELLSDESPLFFYGIIQDGLFITLSISEEGKQIYDIVDDPASPTMLASIGPPITSYQPLSWYDNHQLLLIGGAYEVLNLELLDLNNVLRPREQIVYRLPPSRFAAAEQYENILFVLQNAQLTILDITDFEQIGELSQVEMVGPVSRSLLLEADIFISTNNENVMDVARLIPAQPLDWPTPITYIPIPFAHGYYAHENILVLAYDYGWFDLHDLSTHESNRLLFYEIFQEISYVWYSTFWQGYFYVLAETNLAILDVTDPLDPIIVANYEKALGEGTWRSMVINDSLAFIAGTEGITVLDLSNPVELVEIGYTAVTEHIGHLHVVGNALYGGQRDFFVFDISDPTQPQFVRKIGTPINGQPYGHFLIGTIDGEIAVFDVADPLNPKLVKEVSIGTRGYIMGIRHNQLYVGSNAGIYVFEISPAD